MSNTPTIVRKTSPYLRRPQATVSRMMSDVVIALLPVVAFAIYSFGLSALWVILTATLTMLATEYIYYLIINKGKEKPFTLKNYSALVSGLIFGLTLADGTPLWVIVVTGSLGLLLAKLFFGGLGQNIFNPAALARVLVFVNFSTLTTYTANVDSVAGATYLQSISEGGSLFGNNILATYPLMNLFTGIGLPGSLGEVSAILIIVGAIYLALRHSFEVRIPIVYVGTVFVLASSVALYKGLGIWYPLSQVFSGGLLFGSLFMATDPITSPINKPGRVYYAFALGFVTYIIRLFGALPEGVVFSILIMNMFVPAFDYFKWSNPRFTNKGNYIFAGVILTSILIVLVGVYYAS